MGPGDVIADRFAIERRAGAGGMGEVYQARDRQTGHLLALKVLHPRASLETERFVREAEVLARLHHPGIVRYLGHGQTAAGEPYLAMEWLHGETLAERLDRAELSIAESVALGLRVAEALGEAHRRGVVHRDLKPSNLFLRDGSVLAPALIDFGIARVMRAGATLTAPGMMVGTPGYVAPEQARGEPMVGPRADVFSLGCVLFECLGGREPFVGDDALAVLLKVILEEPPRLRELRPEIPAALEELVTRMLAKAPEARPADGAFVAAALEAIRLLPEPSSRPPESAPVSSITGQERRVLCLVVARRQGEDVAATLSDGESAVRDRAIQAAVERQGGRVELLADGALVVVFSSGGTATDLATRAARCALALKDLLDEASLAVVSGRAVLTGRLPAGELIDQAVALLGRGGARIRLDEGTLGLLGARFEVAEDEAGGYLTRELGALEGTRTLLGKPLPCVGRDRELAFLSTCVAQCIEEPSAGAVLVTAAAGVGKSRLGHELLQRLRAGDEPPEIWIGQGDPLTAGSAFSVIGQAIRSAFGILDGEPIEARRQRIRARVGRQLGADPAAAARVAPFLGELVGTPFPDEDNVQLQAARRDPMLMGDQIRRAFEAFLGAACAERPVLLLLEDLHLGDLPTVKLVDAALRHLRDQPFCVVALGRPEVHALFPDLWAERPLQVLRLRELGSTASARLMRLALGDTVSPATVEATVERAAGNAFYLEELIRAVAEGKDATLPESVLSMVQLRLEGFDPEARRVLRAASIFGQTFKASGVAALLGGVEVHPWLGFLVEREVILPWGEAAGALRDPPEYAFRHALVREAAYGMLTEFDRALGHALAASFLERSGEGDAMALAEHCERGGEPARAAAWYHRAAEHAFEGHDLGAAIARAERGVACLAGAAAPDRELLGRLRALEAEAHRWRGENAETERRGVEAMEVLPLGSAAWCQAAGVVSVASGKLGTTDRIFGIAERLLELASVRDPSTARAIAFARVAGVLSFHTDRPDLAAALLAAAEAENEQLLGDPTAAALIHRNRAHRAMVVGDIGEFLRLSEAARRDFERAGDTRGACHEAVAVAFAELCLGEEAEAEQMIRHALVEAERMGLAALLTAGKQNLGLILAQQGKLAEARAIEEESLRAFQAQGYRRGEAGARIYLAQVLALEGDLDRAAAEASAGAEGAAAVPEMRAFALAILADARLAQGRAAEALAAAREARAALGPVQGIDEGEARVRLTFARALDATGDRDGARAAIAEARARLLARAAKIADPARRRSFLERVPSHAGTLELARIWLGEGAAGPGA